jgi:hypothetical protein
MTLDSPDYPDYPDYPDGESASASIRLARHLPEENGKPRLVDVDRGRSLGVT